MDRIGEIKANKQGTLMKIIRYKDSSDIDVEFLDKYHYVKEHTTYSNFKVGKIKNPYDKTLYGVGYVGVGNHKTKIKGQVTDVYLCWKNMLERCYDERLKEKYPAYNNIRSVCEEWHDYQVFSDWYKEHVYDVDERLHLDKDIKFPGNSVYSPETCLLVPQRINMIFTNKANSRGLPNGIYHETSGYFAKYNTEELGVYTTLESAYDAYAKRKKEEIVKVANEYKDIIPNEVYQALLEYEVLIENDKNYNPKN